MEDTPKGKGARGPEKPINKGFGALSGILPAVEEAQKVRERKAAAEAAPAVAAPAEKVAPAITPTETEMGQQVQEGREGNMKDFWQINKVRALELLSTSCLNAYVFISVKEIKIDFSVGDQLNLTAPHSQNEVFSFWDNLQGRIMEVNKKYKEKVDKLVGLLQSGHLPETKTGGALSYSKYHEGMVSSQSEMLWLGDVCVRNGGIGWPEDPEFIAAKAVVMDQQKWRSTNNEKASNNETDARLTLRPAKGHSSISPERHERAEKFASDALGFRDSTPKVRVEYR